MNLLRHISLYTPYCWRGRYLVSPLRAVRLHDAAGHQTLVTNVGAARYYPARISAKKDTKWITSRSR